MKGGKMFKSKMNGRGRPRENHRSRKQEAGGTTKKIKSFSYLTVSLLVSFTLGNLT